ncbi:GntR family transcriptional regulator [Phycisphaerales bacterium AB-hyl4]|uniref:GntR family transcriptional regulator n=1 Tax=Natronomicrosphaera hydrolytica TaxID=3242702 RepID=A0ABV4U4N4_9BACT
MSKAKQIERILERRIRHGDYLLKELPAERELAEEIGVSRMTARKAVQFLVKKGLLQRQPNGRLVVSREAETRLLHVAFLVPSLVSSDVEQWRLALDRLAEKFNMVTRTILYVHWDDPVLLDAAEGLDGMFLIPNCEPMPDRIMERLRTAGRSLVILGQDMSTLGLPSINLFPAVVVQQLLDHLAELGHRHIDCFNVQTVDPVVRARIDQWNLWRASHRMAGRVLGEPIEPYEQPLMSAYKQMGKILDEGKLQGTGLLCLTAPAAIGAARAMADRNIQVGKDISVCVINDEGLARFMTPSLTSIETPDPTPYLSVCLDWLSGSNDQWVGSLLLEPSRLPLFVGSSTGPAPTSNLSAAKDRDHADTK